MGLICNKNRIQSGFIDADGPACLAMKMNRDNQQHGCDAPYWPRVAMGIFFLAIALVLSMEPGLQWGGWVVVVLLTLLGGNALWSAWRRRRAWIDKIGPL